jgi:phenylalanyl-tRNA synthetase alpha chain
MSNIPELIKIKIGKNLHNQENHPICILKNHIHKFFENQPIIFQKFDNFDPIVNIYDNFDSLLIPKEHPARTKHDTYYVDDTHVLRTHTSAHQYGLMSKGIKNFLVTGDVYRKDEIDYCHYPVFHQMEGVRIVDYDSDIDPEIELKTVLANLIKYLFQTNDYNFQPDYFPFTDPSFEANVNYNSKWLEILGCGVIHTNILTNVFKETKYKGWAFGLGLERLAMILFNIPDIRLFWTDDDRFLNQFEKGNINKFIPYPTLNKVSKDLSMWIPNDQLNIKSNDYFDWMFVNEFYELVRNIFNDSVAEVKLIDKYYNDKKDKYSNTFTIVFTPNDNLFNCTDPAKFNEHCNKQMKMLYIDVVEKLGVVLR